jgi:CheY-like chemotaxis protein
MVISANETKSLFLANMSHEIRSPLAIIIGFAEVMLNIPLQSRENLNFIEPIIRNAKMLIHIVNDILDLAKVESGKFDIIREEILLPEFIRDNMTMLATLASAKGVQLSVSAAKPIPETITSDSLRLRQIILNIVGNAIKFSPTGAAVEIAVSLTQGLRGDEQLLELRITDSGIGITAEEAKGLFKPFAQADMRTSRQFGGTGLGLVLSKQLAEALGGSVVLLESTVGSGSTFVVTIGTGPLEGVALNTFHFSVSRQALGVTPVHIPKILTGMEILVVDDGIDNQVLIRQHLQSAGAKVSVACNGAEGIEMATHHSYTLVLMDLQMPGMDGYEATATLRRQGYGVPIIALTAHAMKAVQERCLAAGFSDYVSKPIDRLEFIKKLATYGSETRT